jgi:hypothetical protein
MCDGATPQFDLLASCRDPEAAASQHFVERVDFQCEALHPVYTLLTANSPQCLARANPGDNDELVEDGLVNGYTPFGHIMKSLCGLEGELYQYRYANATFAISPCDQPVDWTSPLDFGADVTVQLRATCEALADFRHHINMQRGPSASLALLGDGTADFWGVGMEAAPDSGQLTASVGVVLVALVAVVVAATVGYGLGRHTTQHSNSEYAVAADSAAEEERLPANP